MSLADELAAPTAQRHVDVRRQRGDHPTGFEYEWDGTNGYIQTPPLTDKPRTWDALIREAGLDPDEVEVIEPVQVRGWDAQNKEGSVVRLNYYRLNVRRYGADDGMPNIDELVKAAKAKKTRPSKPVTGELAYLVAIGDTQLGKMDGTGTAGTVDRVLEATERAVDRVKELRRIKRPIGSIYLTWLGDCIEGMNSQGGRLMWRTDLTLTEMVRTHRRLLLEQVKALAPLTDQLVVVSVPGNHDEAVRVGDKMGTRYDDSWAIDGASAVQDALNLAGGYDHVNIVVPSRDELTVTLDMAGTVVTCAHGHQFGRGADGPVKWWSQQAHGMQAAGDSSVLLSGHLHHLRVHQTGVKTWLQVPAMDGGSTWFRHLRGEEAPSGVVTATIGADWYIGRDLAVL